MIRYQKDRVLADASPVKSTNDCPEWAGGPCTIGPPNQSKKEEPKAGTPGLPDRPSSTLNQSIIEQKHWIGNRNSRIPILSGFSIGGLVFVDCPWCDRFRVHGWPRDNDARVIESRAPWRQTAARSFGISYKWVSTKGSGTSGLFPFEKKGGGRPW
jgi:hypothetical protein